ncbi:MAG: Helix-turn-helix domain protein [Ilumatobacteraceae bacterium]|nr:Helix-turn-helix domain protein [Ilumatobacteraceae bacterium]MCU1389785.1 Helix-turn-helix domain protein [Ilumatobacteraceae bacterium]
MAWYTPVASPPALDRILACSWTAEPSGTHRLVPDACTDLLWVSTGSIVLCGPETTAWDFALPGGTTAVGVRFRPGAAPRIFGVDASTIRDRRVPMSELVDPVTAQRLNRQLEQLPDSAQRMHALEQFVAEHTPPALGESSDDFVERVLDHLAVSPRARAASLATQLGMTTRQLHRRALSSFGYGTSTLARLLRFQRFLAITETSSPRRPTLARLAVEAGYSDQAHLARDCRAICGTTPTEFLADYFATFPDMSDPYKTAAPFAATMEA